ncbi:MAG: 6-carboxytetrahydropterin synthase [Elusimicrobia bacterium]|nr:MAG: 6-carboxytetrahydropterin synthase [Elusimicrobiota bacterium]
MFSVVREIHFSYGHRLMDYVGKCRHPHGHNGRVEVELSRPRLNRLGMVMDFDEIKKRLQTWIDAHLDHQMILRRDDPLVAVLRKMGEPFYLMTENPTAEALAREIYGAAATQGLPVTRVTVWETEKSHSTYRAAAR